MMNTILSSIYMKSANARFLIASKLRLNPATQIVKQAFGSVTLASECMGVSRSTLHRWLNDEPEQLLRYAYMFDQVGKIDPATLMHAVQMRRLEIDGAEC